MGGLGALAVSLAAVLWALGGTFARVLIDRGASALEITEARAWIATAGIGAIVLARRRRASPRADGEGLPPPRFAAFIPLGMSIAAANYFYYSAIALLPVAVALVIQYTAPGLVVLWLAVVERRRPPARVLAALALAFAGVALLSELPRAVASGEVRLSPSGMAAAAASAVAFAVYMLTGERLGRAAGPDGALFRAFLVAGIFWAALQATRGRPDTLFDTSLLPGVILIGIGATIVPFLLFVWGLARVGASRAGIISTLEPVSGAVIAYLWIGQSLTPLQLAGGAMVVFGIGVVQSERPAPDEVLAERAAVE